MGGAHPYLSLVACLIYVAVAGTCSLAAIASQTSTSRRFWVMGAVFFLALATLRFTGIEAYVTNGLRGWLYEAGTYQDRRDIQRPLAAGAVVALSGALFFFYWKRPKPRAGPREWSKFWGMLGIVAMGGVIAMRLISFHELDRLLYGPIKMNWILDIGSSALVMWAALRFRKLADGGPSGRRPPMVNSSNRRPR